MPTSTFRQDTVRTLPYVGPGGKHQCIYWDTELESYRGRAQPKDPSPTAGYAHFQTQHRRDALSRHAAQVLALSSQHVRPPPQSQTVIAESLVDVKATSTKTPSTATRQRHYFKRQELYELVWTVPVLEIARRLSVSDVAVAKLCRRAEIPIPSRGYWARTEAGQQLPRPAMPPAPEVLPNLLWVHAMFRDTRRKNHRRRELNRTGMHCSMSPAAT